MTVEIRHRTLETNGIRMHVAEAGDGPLVVLCHGFPESWYSWRHQLVALAEAGYHAVAPDQRGHLANRHAGDLGHVHGRLVHADRPHDRGPLAAQQDVAAVRLAAMQPICVADGQGRHSPRRGSRPGLAVSDARSLGHGVHVGHDRPPGQGGAQHGEVRPRRLGADPIHDQAGSHQVEAGFRIVKQAGRVGRVAEKVQAGVALDLFANP